MVQEKRKIFSTGFLKLVAIATPLGFIAVEAGWFVTEVGRQPWIIYGIMRTSEAVTPMPGQIVHLLSFVLFILYLLVVAIWLMRRQIRVLHEGNKEDKYALCSNIFLLVSVYLYCLLGGADFGAGIIELTASKNPERIRKMITDAIAPIWEANHIWLIIAVVILFNGFPLVYTSYQ
jgi:hypothetical protein